MNKFEDFRKKYRYDVTQDHLGDGGSGNVFKAYDLQKDKFVAIKIVSYKNSEADKHSLAEEVKIARSIPDKTNIAVYDECFRLLSHTGFVDVAIMQFYEKGNLKKFLRGQVPLDARKEIVHGIINGLEQVHNSKTIHRDLKPENILIAVNPAGKPVPKITDFGISKQSDDLESSHFSHSLMAGTIAYSSPEQLREGTVSLKFNTDLWSLGVIIYEILAGENPFAQGIDEAVSKEEKRRIMLNRIRMAQLPEELQTIEQPYREIIERCIVINPQERIKSVAAVRGIMEKHLPAGAATGDEHAPQDDPQTVAQPTEEETVVVQEYAPKKLSLLKAEWLLGLAVIAFLLLWMWKFDDISQQYSSSEKLTDSPIIVIPDSPNALIPDTTIEWAADTITAYEVELSVAHARDLQRRDSLQRAIDLLLPIKNYDPAVNRLLDTLHNQRAALLRQYYARFPNTPRNYDCAGERMQIIKLIRAVDTSEVKPQWKAALQQCD